MTDSVNPQLDVDFEKWVKCIRMAIDDKHEVKILKEKIEVKKEFWKTYKILSIDLEKMKARAICIENDKSGNLNITSYDLEELYKHLPMKYKKQEDLKVEESKKVEENNLENKTIEKMENQETENVQPEEVEPETKIEKKVEAVIEEKVQPAQTKVNVKPKKMSATRFIMEFVESNQGCIFTEIDNAINMEDEVKVPKMGLKSYLKLIEYDCKKKIRKLVIKENKYYIEDEKK